MKNQKVVEQLQSALRALGTDYNLTTARNMLKNTINEIVKVENKVAKRKIVLEKEAKQRQEQKETQWPMVYPSQNNAAFRLDRLEKMIQEEKERLEKLMTPPTPPDQNLLG